MKMNFSFAIFLLFAGLMLTGQQSLEQPPLAVAATSRWSSDSFSYTDWQTQEQHSHFSVLYKINPKLHAEVQGFYDTYRMADVFDLSARIKWYPAEKVYLFSGLGMQISLPKGFGEMPVIPMRMLNGVGYEAKKNITIEAVHDLNLSNNGSPSPLSLKGKFRF